MANCKHKYFAVNINNSEGNFKTELCLISDAFAREYKQIGIISDLMGRLLILPVSVLQ